MRIIGLIIPILILAMLATVPAAQAVRSEIDTTGAVPDSSVIMENWTSLSSSTGHYLNYTNDGKQLLLVNTDTAHVTTPFNLTVLEGPFWRGGLGNETFTLAINKTYVLGPFESSRFKQSNGQLYVNSSASHGKILAIELP